MYTAVTRHIRVSVEPAYLESESRPELERYFWAYRVTIANEGRETVKLLARYWRITDAKGRTEEVRGPGVIGQQPELRPGEQFVYTSRAPLTTPSGIMMGRYLMQDATGDSFEIDIPAFSLDSPHEQRQLN
jgi:ApaG protein